MWFLEVRSSDSRADGDIFSHRKMVALPWMAFRCRAANHRNRMGLKTFALPGPALDSPAKEGWVNHGRKHDAISCGTAKSTMMDYCNVREGEAPVLNEMEKNQESGKDER